jgi:hypothetical protein
VQYVCAALRTHQPGLGFVLRGNIATPTPVRARSRILIGAPGQHGVTGFQGVNDTREDYNSRDRWPRIKRQPKRTKQTAPARWQSQGHGFLCCVGSDMPHSTTGVRAIRSAVLIRSVTGRATGGALGAPRFFMARAAVEQVEYL